MLLAALALVVFAAACGLVLQGSHSSRPVTQGASAVDHGSDVWREAALAERGEVRELQHAIATALETHNERHAYLVLRGALERSAGHQPVRVSL